MIEYKCLHTDCLHDGEFDPTCLIPGTEDIGFICAGCFRPYKYTVDGKLISLEMEMDLK